LSHICNNETNNIEVYCYVKVLSLNSFKYVKRLKSNMAQRILTIATQGKRITVQISWHGTSPRIQTSYEKGSMIHMNGTKLNTSSSSESEESSELLSAFFGGGFFFASFTGRTSAGTDFCFLALTAFSISSSAFLFPGNSEK
jgi:hypothetical protein